MRIASLVVAIVLLAACSAPAASSSTPLETELGTDCGSEHGWSLTYSVSGGFVGRQDMLQFASDGSLVAKNERTGEQVEAQAAQDEVDQVTALLGSVCNLPQSEKLPNCADCFEYALTVDLNRQTYEFQANDVSLPESGLVDLVTKLNELMQQAYSGELE
jgi:hypothetical protein